MVKQGKIAVIGSINIDFVIRSKELPTPGETISASSFATLPGGKGANQALAARRLGAETQMIGYVGDDVFADMALANLIKDGVDTTRVTRRKGRETGTAFINVSDSGENQIAVAGGANHLLSARETRDVKADAIIAQLEVPTDAIMESVADNQTLFCLNTAPALAIDNALLRRADILVMNEKEYAFYAAQLPGFEGILVRTLGAEGAIILKDGEPIAQAAPPRVKVIDTTGAGDCFTAAFVVDYLEGRSLERALTFACEAAAFSTTAAGAQNGMPYRDQLTSVTNRKG